MTDEDRDGRFVDAVRDAPLGESFVAALQDFLRACGGQVSWPAFGRVALASDYRYFRSSPIDSRRLGRLARSVHRDAADVFRFLCLAECRPRSAVERWVGRAACESAIARGIIFQDREDLRMMVRLVPMGERCYLADAPAVLAKGRARGLKPAHISQQTHRFLQAMRPIVERRPVASLLEMGCGVGIVCLELRDRVPVRVGVEINPRDLQFAETNRLLAADPGARFTESDLFSGVAERFDAIIFNPWLPSQPHLDTIARFLAQAPRHLNGGGCIALVLSTEEPRTPTDPTRDLIGEFARSNRFSITQFVTESWFETNRRRVSVNSCFLFERGRQRRTIRQPVGRAFLGKTARLAMASARGLLSPQLTNSR